MKDGTYLIGRGTSAARPAKLVIDNPTVSERHAELVVLGDTYYLTDLDSHNGTWRVREDGVQRLSAGYVGLDERLRFGVVECSLADLFSGRELAQG